MTLKPIFFSQGRVRPIWRFFVAAGAVFLAFLLVSLTLGFVFGVTGKAIGFYAAQAFSSLLLLPVLLGVFKLLCLVFEQRPLGAAGLAFCGRWRTELALGLAIGALMILAVAGIEWVSGAARFSWGGETVPQQAGWSLGVLAVLVAAAANEELVFRGYPFQRLVEATGAVGAIVLLSALFGLVHLRNPNRTWISTLNTMLVGIPFSIAYLRTRMLWMPIGMHFAWNFVQGFVLGLPVSGISIPVSILQAEVKGSVLLTGGAYGPEGALPTLMVILLTTGYLAYSKRIYISEETQTLVFGPRAALEAGVSPVQLCKSERHSGSISS